MGEYIIIITVESSYIVRSEGRTVDLESTTVKRAQIYQETEAQRNVR